MLRKCIVTIIAMLICLFLFSGCANKSDEEALKWKTEYNKMHVINQNLEGQLEQQKIMIAELKEKIEQNQTTIEALKQEIDKKNTTIKELQQELQK